MPNYNLMPSIKEIINKIFGRVQYREVFHDPEDFRHSLDDQHMPIDQVIKNFANIILSPENNPRVIAASSLILFRVIFDYLPPYFFSQAIAALREQDVEGEINWNEHYEILMVAACVTYAISQIMPNINSYIMNPVHNNNNTKIIHMIISHIIKNKSLDYHNEVPFGHHMLMINMGFSLINSTTPILETIIPTITETVVSSFILSRVFDMQIGIILLLMLGGISTYSLMATRPTIEINQEILDNTNKAFGTFGTVLRKYFISKVNNKEIYDLDQVKGALKALYTSKEGLQNVTIKYSNIYAIIASSFMLLACLLVTTKEPEDLLMIITIFGGFVNKMQRFGNDLNALGSSLPNIRFILEFLAEKSEIIDEYPDNEIKERHDVSHVSFRNVLFYYPTKPNVKVLNNMTLQFERGRTYAFIGASGVGKTTIFNLLFRFNNPNAGSILINGQDISLVGLRHLRTYVGMLSQKPFLFKGSLRDNIKHGAENPDEIKDEDIMIIADQVGLSSFINGFKEKLSHEVGEEGKFLSGGQQQRVAILRGMMKKSCEIRLLDEITASLDSKTAAEVLSGVIRYDKNNNITTFMISHNLLEISEHANEIIVLDNGNAVAKGRHEYLLQNCNLYMDLWNKQQKDKPTNRLVA